MDTRTSPTLQIQAQTSRLTNLIRKELLKEKSKLQRKDI